MNKNKLLTTTALGLTLALGGCQYYERNDGVTSFSGDTQAINQAKQVEDPWAKRGYDNEIGGDGQRLGDTVKRYKEGQEEKAQEIGTVSTQ